MRADQKMMLGVGAIGLFAVGWLLFGPVARASETEEAVPPAPPGPNPLPPPPPPNVIPLPDLTPRPPIPPPTPQGVQYLSSPATLTQGASYQSIVQLSPLEMAVPFVDHRAAIEEQLRGLGFDSVKVYETLQELPWNWPSETLVNLQDTSATFYAEGTWSHPDETGIPLPPQILKAWKT